MKRPRAAGNPAITYADPLRSTIGVSTPFRARTIRSISNRTAVCVDSAAMSAARSWLRTLNGAAANRPLASRRAARAACRPLWRDWIRSSFHPEARNCVVVPGSSSA